MQPNKARGRTEEARRRAAGRFGARGWHLRSTSWPSPPNHSALEIFAAITGRAARGPIRHLAPKASNPQTGRPRPLYSPPFCTYALYHVVLGTITAGPDDRHDFQQEARQTLFGSVPAYTDVPHNHHQPTRIIRCGLQPAQAERNQVVLVFACQSWNANSLKVASIYELPRNYVRVSAFF
jgi:hypothetical protein